MAKTIAEKLGLKAGRTGWVHGRPADVAGLDGFAGGPVPATAPDVVLAFVRTTAEVGPALDTALPHYRRGRALWFAYPKKTGGIRTDIGRDHGWEPAFALDLLPVAQIAIDGTWSALRFRHRDEIPVLTRTRAPGA